MWHDSTFLNKQKRILRFVIHEIFSVFHGRVVFSRINVWWQKYFHIRHVKATPNILKKEVKSRHINSKFLQSYIYILITSSRHTIRVVFAIIVANVQMVITWHRILLTCCHIDYYVSYGCYLYPEFYIRKKY